MADKKISALTSLAQGDVAASTDVLPIVDTSATETKKITASALVGAGMTAGVTNVDINSGSIDGTTIGASSASTGAFTTLSASSTVSGTGFSTYLASPPAIGGTTAAAGSFTTLTTSSTVTLNGGTANGVLYLNGSKVATSGSAFVFDGTNVGIGTASPDANFKLDVQAATGRVKLTSTTGTNSVVYQANNTGGTLNVGIDSSTGGSLFGVGAYAAGVWYSGNYPLVFGVNNAEGFRLTSSTLYTASGINVGIGTSSLQSGTRLTLQESASNPSALAIRNRNSTQTWQISVDAAAVDDKILAFIDPGAGVVRMALDSSGNLGIGTSSPSVRLMLEQAANSAPVTLLRLNNSGTTGGGPGIASRISFTAGATALGYIQGSNYASGATGLQFSGDGTNAQATLDSSGNLGLGVTPSAWYSNTKVLQLNYGAFGTQAVSGTTAMFNNAYEDGNETYKYYTTNAAAMYRQTLGVHRWYSAASGTAGNAITFTQAMTLDASGNLGVGLTDPGSFGKFAVSAAGIAMHSNSTSGAAGLNLYENGSGRFSLRTLNGSAGLAFFDTFNTVERARITSDGYFKAQANAAYISSSGLYHEFVGDSANAYIFRIVNDGNNANRYGMSIQCGADNAAGTNYALVFDDGDGTRQGEITFSGGTTTYGTSSDYRLKENVQPIKNALNRLARLRPVKWNWKRNGLESEGFVAHELQEVVPIAVAGEKDAVNENGDPVYQSVGAANVVPLLTKALQEAMARIEQLEAKVAALESK